MIRKHIPNKCLVNRPIKNRMSGFQLAKLVKSLIVV